MECFKLVDNDKAKNEPVKEQLTTPNKRRNRRKSTAKCKLTSPDEEETNERGIKSRLRGAERTPGKVCKDSVSEANIKILKRSYKAEGESLQQYLGKQREEQETTNTKNIENKEIEGEETEVLATPLDTIDKSTSNNVYHGQVDSAEAVQTTAARASAIEGCVNKQLMYDNDNTKGSVKPTKANKKVDASTYIEDPDSDTNTVQANQVERRTANNDKKHTELNMTEVNNPASMIPKVVEAGPNEIEVAEMALKELEKKFENTKAGSMESMFFEMRIDMKKDSGSLLFLGLKDRYPTHNILNTHHTVPVRKAST